MWHEILDFLRLASCLYSPQSRFSGLEIELVPILEAPVSVDTRHLERRQSRKLSIPISGTMTNLDDLCTTILFNLIIAVFITPVSIKDRLSL
ncbi:Protein of unknown function [Pyronema omphalodes CBS 100304]|uniref:Uncharacterized protein n=1 Tax=Pyronema omphalodes (strain CBS 100304) TaxID=1076935 RepID=U4KXE4_PYROM|nr:Protein of unknown function [Pyronema omphalodes CBS 100304]